MAYTYFTKKFAYVIILKNVIRKEKKKRTKKTTWKTLAYAINKF